MDLEGRAIGDGWSCQVVGRGSNDAEKGHAEPFHAQCMHVLYSKMSVGDVFKVVHTSGVSQRTWAWLRLQ